MVFTVVSRSGRTDREGETGHRAFSQHLSIDLSFRLLRLCTSGSADCSDIAQLPTVVSCGEVSAEWKGLRVVSRPLWELAWDCARMLSGQSRGDGGDSGNARSAPRLGKLADESRCLYRALAICPAEVHRGWASCRAHRSEAELHGRRSSTRGSVGRLCSFRRSFVGRKGAAAATLCLAGNARENSPPNCRRRTAAGSIDA